MIDLKSLATYEARNAIPSRLFSTDLRYFEEGAFTPWTGHTRFLDHINNQHSEEIPQYPVPDVEFTCPEEDMQRLLHFVHQARFVDKRGDFAFSNNHGLYCASGKECLIFLLASHWAGTIDLNLWKITRYFKALNKVDAYMLLSNSRNLGMKLTEAVYTLLSGEGPVELRVTHSEGEEIIHYPF